MAENPKCPLVQTQLPLVNHNFGLDSYFEFIKSGEIDLSAYKGNINIAFKVKGSGTNNALDGSYQVDAIRIYTKS